MEQAVFATFYLPVQIPFLGLLCAPASFSVKHGIQPEGTKSMFLNCVP